MPKLDKTGPRGQGPKTGRGLGVCDPINNKNEINKKPLLKRGVGQGLGRLKTQIRKGNR